MPEVRALRVKVDVLVRTGNCIPQLAEIVGAVCTHDHMKVNPAATPVSPIIIEIKRMNQFKISVNLIGEN